jgi:hypothetical protein
MTSKETMVIPRISRSQMKEKVCINHIRKIRNDTKFRVYSILFDVRKKAAFSFHGFCGLLVRFMIELEYSMYTYRGIIRTRLTYDFHFCQISWTRRINLTMNRSLFFAYIRVFLLCRIFCLFL